MRWDMSQGPAGLDDMEEHCPSDEEPQRHTVFWWISSVHLHPFLMLLLLNCVYEGWKEMEVSIYSTDEYTSSALLCQGLVPCVAIIHSVAISVRTSEVFRRTQLQSPHLSTQAFIRMLCNLHQVCIHLSFFVDFSQCIP